MDLTTVFDFSGKTGVSGLFDIDCSAGSFDGSGKIEVKNTSSGFNAVLNEKSYQATCTVEKKHGIYVRRDKFTNTSDSHIFLYRYFSRFTVLNNDNEVYTNTAAGIMKAAGAGKSLMEP